MNYRISCKTKCNYLFYFIAISLTMMIGFRMDGHENMRDKVGWNSVEKQDHESMPNINRKICKSQIVMNEKLW